MQPARHQIVHNVVAARDLVEHVVDEPLFFRQRHLLEAEMGRGLLVGMGLCHRELTLGEGGDGIAACRAHGYMAEVSTVHPYR